MLSVLWGPRPKSASFSSPVQWLREAFGGAASKAGVSVTEDKVLGLPGAYSAVRIISESVSQLPVGVVLRTEDGRVPQPNHAVSRIIARPNRWMTFAGVVEAVTASAALRGNGYAFISQTATGDPIEMFPLPSAYMKPKTNDDTGDLEYEYTHPRLGGAVTYPARCIFHLRSFGTDGYAGRSPISLFADSLGRGIAVRDFGASLFGSGASQRLALVHPGILTPTARSNIRRVWDEHHSGPDNAHKLALLEEGMKPVNIGINPEDAQLVDVEKLTLGDCARIWRVPPHMISELSNATFSNIDSQQQSFLTGTLAIWLVRWEMEAQAKLFNRPDYRLKFHTNALLRGDATARSAYYKALREMGVFSVNEIRALEDLDPIGPEGDTRLEPMNFRTLGTGGSMVEAAGPVTSATTDGESVVSDTVTAAPGPESTAGAVAEHDDEVDAASADRAERLDEVFRRLLADFVGRLARIEGDKLRRANRRDPAGVNEWLVAFIERHADHVRRELLPVAAAYWEATGRPFSAEAMEIATDEYLKRLVADVENCYDIMGEDRVRGVADAVLVCLGVW